MENIYAALDFLLPFSWAGHLFMKNALLGVLLVTPLFGVLGTMVVANRLAFFADSLGHSAFTGIALGVLLGVFSPRASLCVFSILFAVFVIFIKRKSGASADTVIGVFSSTAVALGLMLMSYGGSFGKYSAFLIGDLLSISPDELAALLMVFFAVFVIWALSFNRLLLVAINPAFAGSRGIKTFAVETIFAVTLAVVVAMSIEWVGILIINSLLVLPAAGAANISRGVREYHLIAVLISLFSGVAGLILAYYFNMAAGATIALVAATIFFVTLAAKKYVSR